MTAIFEEDVLEVSVSTSNYTGKVEEAMNLINSIDLTMVKKKLMDEEGQGWDEEYSNYVEQRYKRYLDSIE